MKFASFADQIFPQRHRPLHVVHKQQQLNSVKH